MSKLEIGNKVYLKPINNRARNGNKEIQEYEVKSVGRKYFEVWQDGKEHKVIKFNIESNTNVTNYSPDWKLYFNKQDILDEFEREEVLREVRLFFDGWGQIDISLEKLKEIHKIIKG